jgi:outer membrane protein TolC
MSGNNFWSPAEGEDPETQGHNSRANGTISLTLPLITGGDFSIYTSNQRTFNTGTFFVNEELVSGIENYGASAGVSYNQPLLEGFRMSGSRYSIESASIQLKAAEQTLSEARISLVDSVKQSWYSVIKARETVEVRKMSLRQAEELAEVTRAKVEQGILAEFEILQAESGIYSRREELLIADTAFANARESLLEELGLSLDSRFEIVGEVEKPGAKSELDAGVLTETALEHRQAVRLQRETVALNRLVVKRSRDRLKPQLDFSAGMGFAGSDMDWSGAWDNMSDERAFQWSTGLTYTVPVGGNKSDKAAWKQAKLNLENSLILLEETERAVELEVRAAVRRVDTAWERVQVSLEGQRVQERKLEIEEGRYAEGLSTSYILLDFQEDLDLARLAHLEALIEYRLALSNLDRVLGRLEI